MSTQTDTLKLDWRIISWLRGLAALYVTINHCRGRLFSDAMMYAERVNPKENWQWWEHTQMFIMNHTSLGSEFVILFFLLSGFSIAHSLKGTTNISTFYKRRLIRLYPPYILGIAWSFVVLLLIWAYAPDIYYNAREGYEPFKVIFEKIAYLPTLLSNLLYMPKDNYLTHQYWSLPYEVIFYLAAPWIIKHFRIAGITMLVIYIACLLLFGIGHKTPGEHNIFFLFGNEYGIYFIVGILFYKYKDWLYANFKLNKIVSIFAALAIFEVLIITKGYLFEGMPNKITGALTIVLTYILLFSALKYKMRINWLEKVGDYSYTLYVTHWATIHAYKIVALKLGLGFHYIDNLFFWYSGVLVCLGTSYLMYFMAERPGNKYIERLRKQPANIKYKQPSTPVLGAEVA